jgi:polysaccharide pyruvyl transferase WcaK-like protein
VSRARGRAGAEEPSTARVGIFGFLGSGNLGNDAAFEVVLRYLREEHPDVNLDAMCMGPERLKSYYGVDAVPMLWYKQYEDDKSPVASLGLKVIGKVVATARTASWVRQHDVVIVPGAGALEASLPLRASGYPYSMFLLCGSGRLFGTKVALVSVGANRINQRLTRWLFNSAAALASYRSYRDQQSWEAMRQRGVDVSQDGVYPDLVFGLPAPEDDPGDPRTVGVGLMAYYGGNNDRRQADELHVHYVETLKRFIRWLVDSGHRVRLFWGDNAEEIDGVVVEEILADLRVHRPEAGEDAVDAAPCSSPAELMAALSRVGTFVGTRYHNVVSALRLSKPTISIGYSAKFEALMADMEMSEFCQLARAVDLDRLIEQFIELERRAPELRRALRERNRENTEALKRQFALLSTLLFETREPAVETATV